MSAASAVGRLSRRIAFGLTASSVILTLMTSVGHAEQETATQGPPSALDHWDGTTAVTIEELRRHAKKIGQLLDHASARVDRLADEADETSEERALVGALRQELDLSRRWNRHLSSILLEVTEARQALGVREQKATAEIVQLTSIAEEARLELIALWKSLKPGMAPPPVEPDMLPTPKAGFDQSSVKKAGGNRIEAVAEQLAGPDATIEEARKTLEAMDEAQKSASGDIEAVRSKIIDALHTLAPHRRTPLKVEVPSESHVQGDLSSQDITAWAASIATKAHHEGYEDADHIEENAGLIPRSAPDVETMVMEGKALSTTAVRIAPDRLAASIATVIRGSSILVTGKVVDQDWYRVEIKGGRHGFVAGDLIKRLSKPDQSNRPIKPS